MRNQSRVLIVDDDSRNIRILYEILGSNFELSSAEDGESALVKIKEFSPDLVLLDIMMPGIDGYEVCRRIKNTEGSSNIKVILVSGKALTEERIKGYESGADDFVTKPFDMDEILAKVKVFVKLKSMEEVNKLKTDFLSLINHETGTPLNHIIGISDLLTKQGGLDDSISESLNDINVAAHSLYDKINKILFLAKLKQTTLVDIVDMDIKDMLSEVSMLVDGEDIQYEICEGLSLKGNFELIQKLFVYLLMKASHESSSSIVCEVKPGKSLGGVNGIIVNVIDDGRTLNDAQLRSFFDPFYIDDIMLHSEGMNLTMAICSQIADIHHGSIEVKNNETSGICVTVWFPDG